MFLSKFLNKVVSLVSKLNLIYQSAVQGFWPLDCSPLGQSQPLDRTWVMRCHHKTRWTQDIVFFNLFSSNLSHLGANTHPCKYHIIAVYVIS